MALTYPLDFIDDWPGITTLNLEYVQEFSPSRGGVQNSADLGPALWMMTGQSKLLSPNNLRMWKARLAALENGARVFRGWEKTANFPILYPKGSWPTGSDFNGFANLFAVNINNKTMRLTNLPAGYVVSIGDYVSFQSGGVRQLLQAMESVTASGAGTTPSFEVRPPIIGSDALTADLAASPQPSALVKKTYAYFVLVPDSVQAPNDLSAWGSITFQARQTPTAD